MLITPMVSADDDDVTWAETPAGISQMIEKRSGENRKMVLRTMSVILLAS